MHDAEQVQGERRGLQARNHSPEPPARPARRAAGRYDMWPGHQYSAGHRHPRRVAQPVSSGPTTTTARYRMYRAPSTAARRRPAPRAARRAAMPPGRRHGRPALRRDGATARHSRAARLPPRTHRSARSDRRPRTRSSRPRPPGARQVHDAGRGQAGRTERPPTASGPRGQAAPGHRHQRGATGRYFIPSQGRAVSAPNPTRPGGRSGPVARASGE